MISHVTCTVVIITATILLGACSPAQQQSSAQREEVPRAVNFARVERRILNSGLNVSGRLIAREEAAVASQLTGYQVSRVLVDLGDYVRAGQPLATLDDTLLRADIALQRANVAQAEVGAERAAQEAQRVSALDKTGVLSDEAIAERRLAARTANAQLSQARAQLSAQLIRQNLMLVRSSVSGRILTRSVRPGDVASPSNVMFTIAADQIIEMDAEIPEQHLTQVHAGDTALITLPSGANLRGIVRLISAQVDPDTRLGRARITLPLTSELRPGGLVKAMFGAPHDPTLTVPDAAITYSAQGAYVVAIDATNHVRQVSVRIGRRGGGHVEILSGISVNTPVLTGSQDFVLPGDIVRPVSSGAS
ncbi:efflux RND transporter periplasmic adaptor subunit [Sphingobium sp. AP50]|uniref:efflux RND transporter periplasmic adaptor subunit n=1 Tax=Sphingobium sp. AP50 TaxID=1884369 RepID=UPI0015A60C1F|nr:efflux RND transporter periplasmic adaptor subunit [Sphingobium sp. AP50]